jgi:adenylate cyclase
MGDQTLKNIARPVRVYRVRLTPTETMPKATPAESGTVLALPDKPSIAVLPFANMSNDPEQEYFADGIAEDIITALSRYPSLFVIARNSCFTYKGRAVDVKQVGRELGVRYVLEGSLRKSGNRIRVTGQLVEAETGNHVWAERYDRNLADIFAVQDEITQAVTIAIAPAIAEVEQRRAMRKPPGNFDAWTAYQRGWWHFSKANPEDNVLAQRYFQQAIDVDPAFAGGYVGLALTQHEQARLFQTRRLTEAQNLAEVLARQAISLDGADAEARTCLSVALFVRGDHVGALAEVEQALKTSPNLPSAHGALGSTLIFSCRLREGIAALDKCIRLDPRAPTLRVPLTQKAIGLYFAHEYEDAVQAAKRAIRLSPEYPNCHRWLAAALGQLGRTTEAKGALEKAISIAPESFDMYARQGVPWFRPEDQAHMVEGLRKAGWSD